MEPSADDRRRALPTWLGIVLAVLIVAVLTGLFRARVDLQPDPPPSVPLTVATVDYRVQESYRRQASYLGLVVSGRKANMAFEIPGRIEALPHRQGSPVSAGQVIAKLDSESLEARHKAASANLKRSRAELELARLKARRQKELRASGAVSREAFDETRLQATALEAAVEAVQAELASIEVDLENSALRAPYAGIIADHYVHEGAVINPGTPVVRLVETANLEAHVGVAAALADTLEPGKRYPLELRGEELEAELLSVRPDVHPLTRTATAVFALPPGVNVLDGEPVTLTLSKTLPQTGGWLPLGALLEGRRGLWTVLRVESRDAQHMVLREAVEVLEVQGDRAYVRGTLADGALVVASGTHRVTPGTPVSLR